MEERRINQAVRRLAEGCSNYLREGGRPAELRLRRGKAEAGNVMVA
jgi:hypothetical protein